METSGKKPQRWRVEFSKRRSTQVTTALPGKTSRKASCAAHLYRLQGSVNPHLDNRIAKERRFRKASCKRTRISGREEAFVGKEKRNGSEDPGRRKQLVSGIQATKKSSYKEHRVDALAPYAEEGRGKLRKATGSRKQASIR